MMTEVESGELPQCIKDVHEPWGIRESLSIRLPDGRLGYLVLDKGLWWELTLHSERRRKNLVDRIEFDYRRVKTHMREKRARHVLYSNYLRLNKPYILLDLFSAILRLESRQDSPDVISIVVNTPMKCSTIGDDSTYHRGLMIYFKGKNSGLSSILLLELSYENNNNKEIYTKISHAILDRDLSWKNPPVFTMFDDNTRHKRSFFEWELGPFIPLPNGIFSYEVCVKLAKNEHPMNGGDYDLRDYNCQIYVDVLFNLIGKHAGRCLRNRGVETWPKFLDWTSALSREPEMELLKDYVFYENPALEKITQRVDAVVEEEREGQAREFIKRFSSSIPQIRHFQQDVNVNEDILSTIASEDEGGEENEGEDDDDEIMQQLIGSSGQNEWYGTIQSHLKKGIEKLKSVHPFKSKIYAMMDNTMLGGLVIGKKM